MAHPVRRPGLRHLPGTVGGAADPPRTDRILPNGWCLLPPRQSCHKGNACLTCDKFATDATFLPELRTQQARTRQPSTTAAPPSRPAPDNR